MVFCHQDIPLQWKHSTLINEDAQAFLERETYSARPVASIFTLAYANAHSRSLYPSITGHQVLSEEVRVCDFFLKKSLTGHHKTMTMIAVLLLCYLANMRLLWPPVVKKPRELSNGECVCKYGRRRTFFFACAISLLRRQRARHLPRDCRMR